MNDEAMKQNRINQADQAYRNAVFEALMNYQAIEDLLRDCILKTYEIINATCHEMVTFHPSQKHINDIRKKMGLGGLAETFKSLTSNKDLCERIIKEANRRNMVAHKAAAEYLKFPVSDNGARECDEKAGDIDEAATIANWLYFELLELHQKLMEVHGQAV